MVFKHTTVVLPSPDGSCTLAPHTIIHATVKLLNCEKHKTLASKQFLKNNQMPMFPALFSLKKKNMLAFWIRTQESQENYCSLCNRAMFVTNVRYMLWCFTNITDILKSHEMVYVKWTQIPKKEINENFIQCFKFTLCETPQNREYSF